MTQQPGFRVLITSIPDDAARQKTLRLLVRLMPHIPPQTIKEKLAHLPFYLNRQPQTVAQFRPMVEKLQEFGVTVKAIPVKETVETGNPPAPASPSEKAPAEDKSRDMREIFARLHKKKGKQEKTAAAAAEQQPAASKTPAKRTIIKAPEAPPKPAGKGKERGEKGVARLSGMARMAAIGLPLLLLAIGGGYYYWTNQQGPRPADSPITVSRPAASHVAGRAARPLDDLRREWFAAYRPMPDLRFIEAHRLLTSLDGKAAPAADVRLQEGDWRIQIQGQPPFTLAEGASFETLWEGLAGGYQAAPAQGATQGVVQRDQQADPLAAIRPVIAMFWAPAQLEAIKLLHEGRERIARPAEYYHLTAEALLNLALQSSDRTELRDGLFTRALIAAVAAESEGANINHLKTLLAWGMGYEDAARRMAVSLHQDDPVRELASGNWERFHNAASRNDSAIRARYLALTTLAMRHADTDELRQAAVKLFPGTEYVPAIASVMFVGNDNAAKLRAAMQLSAAMLQELHVAAGGREESAPKPSPEAVADFESLLAGVPTGKDPLDPGRISRLYWNQGFWNGIWAWSQALRDDAAALSDFATRLSGESPMAVQFRAFQLARVGDPIEAVAMQAALGGADALPWSMLMEGTLAAAAPTPVGRSLLRLITERGDERPGHLAAFGLLAQNILLDRERADTFYTRALEVAPFSHSMLEPRIAASSGNIARLRNMLEERQRPTPIRMVALRMLQRAEQATAADGHTLFDPLLAEQPQNTSIRSQAIRFFEEAGDYDAAGQHIDAWLRHAEAGSPQHRQATIAKARLMHKSNQSTRAWPLVEPEITIDDTASVILGARIAFAAGERKRGVRLALDAYQDRRDIDTLLLNVELLWRLGICKTSAELLAKHGAEVTWRVWRDRLAPLFLDTLGDKPETQQKCIATLPGASPFPFNIAQFALGIAENSETPPRYTLELLEMVKPDDLGGIETHLEGFQLVERLNGFEKALEWLQGRFQGQDRGLLPELFYDQKQDVLLWRFFGEPRAANLIDRVWLLRAAAMVRDGDPAHPKREELRAHFRKPGTPLEYRLGRYLSGYGEENELYNLASSARETARIAYFLGLKAGSEQRLQDAVTWMQIARESGAVDTTEYQWAGDWLQGRFKGL